MGLPTIMAAILPVIIIVGALALSSQSSLARRTTITLWTGYLAVDLAESAIGEASHFLQLEDVFDPVLFKPIYDEASSGSKHWPSVLQAKMADNYKQTPSPDPLAAIPEANRDYREIKDSGGTVQFKIFAAFRFPTPAYQNPAQEWKKVTNVPGLVKEVAKARPEVVVEGDDMTVEVRPLTFRREFYAATSLTPDAAWVNWGVVQFRVRVRTREIQGRPVVREIVADRRFTLPNQDKATSGGTAAAEKFRIATDNLRLAVTRVE